MKKIINIIFSGSIIVLLNSCFDGESYDQPTVGFDSQRDLFIEAGKGQFGANQVYLEFSKVVEEAGTVTIGVDQSIGVETFPPLDPFSNSLTINITPGTRDTSFLVTYRDFVSQGLFIREYPHNFSIEAVSGGVKSIGLKNFRVNIVDFDALNPLSEIRALYSGSNVLLNENLKFRGVVSSYNTEGAIFRANGYIQDESGAIRLAFGTINPALPNGNLANPTDFTFQPGDTLEITGGNGATIRRRFTEEVEIALTPANVRLISSGTAPEPLEISIADLNGLVYESRFVVLKNVEFTNGGNEFFGGTPAKTFRDSDGNLGQVFTNNGATFAGEVLPTGKVDIVGIVARFNNIGQIVLRSTADIKAAE